MVPFLFGHQEFWISSKGALFWPTRKALLLADLHLEKASFLARLGQLVPPHDSIETLRKIEQLIIDTGAGEVWCLGDSFHDRDGGSRLSGAALERLHNLAGRVDWIWITGNHDHLSTMAGTGRIEEEAVIGGICLRHETRPDDARPEISGHWHPKLKVKLRGHSVTRRCFVHSQSPDRLVLPAFGTFTGGLYANDPAILSVVGQPAEAILSVNDRLLRFPLKD
jgi:DNA ligase-associated metallophosphoesterase